MKKLSNQLKNRIEEGVSEYLKYNEEKPIFIYDGEDFYEFSELKLKKHKPSTKEIRLALELLPHFFPLYARADRKTKAEFIIDLFNFDCDVERIVKILPFKKILFKKVISEVKNKNGKYKVKLKKVRKIN